MIIPYFEGWTFHSENIFMFTSILPPNLTHWSPFLGWASFFWGPRRGTRSGYGLQALQGPATSCGQHRLHGLRHRSSPRWLVGICPATWAQWWSWSSTVQGLVVIPQAKRSKRSYTAFSWSSRVRYDCCFFWDWKHATLICSTFSGVYYVPSGNLT